MSGRVCELIDRAGKRAWRQSSAEVANDLHVIEAAVSAMRVGIPDASVIERAHAAAVRLEYGLRRLKRAGAA